MNTHSIVSALVLALASFLVTGVPVAAQEQAVVSTRVIYPGETISVDALDEVFLRRPPRGNTAIARMLEDVDGKVARRTLLPGRLIPISYVRDAYLQRRLNLVYDGNPPVSEDEFDIFEDD